MTTEFEKKKERHASGESSMSNDSVSNYIPTPPDGGYGWVIVFASFVNHIIVDGISFTFGVFYMEFVDYFKESKGKTALVGSLLCGVYLLTGPIAGALTNKYGCRPVCIAGGLITSAAFILSTFSNNVNMLMLTYGVMGGFGFGLVYLPSVVSVSYYFERRRALATGIAVCGAGVGCFIFAPVSRLLLDTFDWKNSMLIVAAVVLNSVVCGMLLLPLEPPNKVRKPRAKNVIDRLVERAKQRLGRRTESVSEAAGGGNASVLQQRVREVKLARERALRADSESESEMGSQPLAALHGVRRDWAANGTGGRTGSFTTRPRIVVESEARPEHDESFISSDCSAGTPAGPDEYDAFLKLPRIRDLNGSANGSLPAPVNGFLSAPANGFLSPRNGDALISSSANPIWKGGPLPVAGPPARRRHGSRPSGIRKEDYARPMYRKDIFYSGSILHIPQFLSQPDMTTYVRSITSIPRELPPHARSFCSRCVPKVARDVLADMLDLSLLHNPLFIIICIGNILGMVGLYVPFVYIAEKAVNVGIAQTNAVFLLSVIGITNTLGRVLVGWLADFSWVNSLLLHNVAVVGAGVTCTLIMFCNTYAALCVFAAAFGLFVATWISLTSITLCDLIGIEKLTNAFGLLTLARGLAVIVGPPIAGFVYDATQNLDRSFQVGGVMMIIAGLICSALHLPYFRFFNQYQHDDAIGSDMLTEVGPKIGPDVTLDVPPVHQTLLTLEGGRDDDESDCPEEDLDTAEGDIGPENVATPQAV